MEPQTAPHRIHHVSLEYPEEWAVTLNPQAAAVERDVESWLRRIGVLRDRRGAEVFRRLHVAGYGGWPFPRADRERLETFTRFLTLWIFYDDGIEGRGEPREDLLRAALLGEGAPDADPCLRGWWEIAQRYRGARSDAWRERLAERFLAWARSLRDEAEQVAALRGGAGHPGLAEYLAVREVSVGLLPTLCLLEHDLDAELPAALHEHPALQELCRLAAWVVAIFNDLCAFSKDQQAGWVNAVLGAQADCGGALPAAFSRAASLHNRCVFRMLAVEAQVRGEVGDDPLLGAWLQRLHALIPGLARWQLDAGRYSRVHALGAHEELRLGAPWEDLPAGG